MTTLLATIRKELLELRRDRAGILVLLVMPMALVLIVSLVQDNVMQATGETPIRVLLVDFDNGFLGRAVEKNLRLDKGLELTRKQGDREISEEAARKAVVDGDFRFCILIAPGTGAALREQVRRRADESFVGNPEPAKPAAPATVPGLILHFDPAVQGTFRTAVVNSLQRALLGIELREKGAALSDTIERKMRQGIGGGIPLPPGEEAAGRTPPFRFELDAEPVLKLTEAPDSGGRSSKRPTAAQQNVPAWALFGMFFIVVPVSGALIRERQTGTFRRLMTMPISLAGLLAGKVVAYVLVCTAQFVLMVAIGSFALPLLGTSGLILGPEWPIVGIVALSAALAATGYGIMVGVLARSYEQASVFGAVSVVIAAALGGVMIPVYVMPRSMQAVSVVSPLAWGLNAFQDVFVREGTLRTVGPNLARLILFSLATLSVAWWSLRRSRSGE
ncbi:MAG: ABC transporter permease [bacterium]|nr:ABC transporter permease [bacterium]